MYDNVLVESLNVEKLYGEYLGLINKYHNINRSSIFCRYLNVNRDVSALVAPIHGTFDKFHSGVKYDVYDLTPTYYTSQVTNEHSDNQDLVGQMYQGFLSITVYSIKEPHVEDLVIYTRQRVEVFRVTAVKASLNAMYSNPNVNWFELTLEYAPIIQLNSLSFNNHYVYSLSLQRYLFKNDFEVLLKETEKLHSLLKILENNCFNKKYELYTYRNSQGEDIAPLFENKIIYDFLCRRKEYEDHFAKLLRPFGVKHLGIKKCFNTTKGILEDYIPNINLTHHSILNFNDEVNVYNIAVLISKWKWYSLGAEYGL